MYKPVIVSRYISQRHKSEENNYLVNKLNKVKPTIDIKCPDSFTFYKLNNVRKNKTLTKSNILILICSYEFTRS